MFLKKLMTKFLILKDLLIMTFDCYYRKEMWTGKISMFNDYGSHIEMRIESLSSITVLFGRSSLGYFACMPDFKASCHLIHPENERYNKEKLISVMNPIDGITVARALNVLFENLN